LGSFLRQDLAQVGIQYSTEAPRCRQMPTVEWLGQRMASFPL